jgi:hypothetical protein
MPKKLQQAESQQLRERIASGQPVHGIRQS